MSHFGSTEIESGGIGYGRIFTYNGESYDRVGTMGQQIGYVRGREGQVPGI